MQAMNYIDYEDVVALDGIVRTVRSDIEAQLFSKDYALPIKFNYVESQITLEDSLWQIFSEPQEITLLNIDLLLRTEFTMPDMTSHLTYYFDLSKEVYREGRQVTSFPSLFGDISGLRDFFNFLIMLAISSSQTKMFQFNLLRTFFRYNTRQEHQNPEPDLDIQRSRKRFTRLDLGLVQKLRYSLYSFCLSKSTQRKQKVFKKGLERIEDSLDIRAIIRNQRALKILQSLTLTKLSRQLIHIQRKTTVLDLKRRPTRHTKDDSMSSKYEIKNETFSSTSDDDEHYSSEKEAKILRQVSIRQRNQQVL